ncbi:Fic family protein [Terrisporobacter petrolearius]|uniref:Fic family protein n=1 Tax=Terrisporobacter petrolearius TaxID=1460447 RepID=UPI001D16E112|nr:Fic family protein [Terrisporobacter petrolearius]MCC3863092.1 Fic family protein [Terrisporobacter petrolearius]
MGYTMGTKLANISVDMNNVKKLCKINEYKGEQIVYKKQPKNVVALMTDDAILKFVYDTYIDSFLGGQENLVKLIHNEITPQSRDEISVVEFRDVIKTINSAFEDIKISSQTILELHGYLHRYSLTRGGRYRNEAIVLNDLGESNDDFDNVQDIGNKVESLCEKYYKFLEENKIQDLIIIASFIMDFMLISPFKEDNLAMSKILTLLLLNKSGYEIGRFTSLGNLYNDENYSYFKTIFSKQGDLERQSYNMNKWLDYFLSFILNAYEDLNEEMNLTGSKKETKTRRIEKVINSTLGYFTKDDVRNQCPDIPEPTINRVFNNLRKSGKIEVVAKGRSAKWKKR